MNQILAFTPSKLRKDEHTPFMSKVKTHIDTSTPAALGIDTEYLTFCNALTAEEAALLVEVGSLISRELAALDAFIDQILKAIGKKTDSHLLSPFETERESAQIIQFVLDQFGDIASNPYNEENQEVDNLVKALQLPSRAEHLERTCLTAWVTELKKQNDLFKTKFDQRTVEMGEKGKSQVKACRLVTDAKYQAVVNKIEAFYIFQQNTDAHANFVKTLNNLIEYTKNTLAARAGRNKNNGTQDGATNNSTPIT